MNFNLLENLALPADVIASEQPGVYRFMRCVSENEIVNTAKTLLGRRVLKTRVIENTQVTKDFFIAQLSALNFEVFCVAFLNTKHRVISCEHMFRGTVDSAYVYTREVVQRALDLNASAVIFAHNHPSGEGTPSTADHAVTLTLIKALNLFDIRVLDHCIVAGSTVTSFAETGLLSQIMDKAR